MWLVVEERALFRERATSPAQRAMLPSIGGESLDSHGFPPPNMATPAFQRISDRHSSCPRCAVTEAQTEQNLGCIGEVEEHDWLESSKCP